ncbi:MAG: EsaB/YukD family protein [Lachnospiraceae bacterium]|nr:EsaB/YukD family protein [Lachnospiraceae bacterium]
MDKILICLEVPSISQSYEIYVPDFLAVKELIPLLVKAVSELSENRYVSSGCEFLCAKEPDFLLDEDAALSHYEIGNGDHLLLM